MRLLVADLSSSGTVFVPWFLRFKWRESTVDQDGAIDSRSTPYGQC